MTAQFVPIGNPLCEECLARMIPRTGPYGKFWACTECEVTEEQDSED